MKRTGVVVTKEYTGVTEYAVLVQVEADITEWAKANPNSPYAWIIDIYPLREATQPVVAASHGTLEEGVHMEVA